MSYYGGTVTVGGRNMIATLLKGDTLTFTKVTVGKGKLAADKVPLDQTALVSEVAAGTSTPPIIKDGICTMTVEYRNDMNGGLQTGFWLNEFGIFAKTDKSPECLFYYATLGDSPQPVSKYSKDRVDIRRYPITIALEVDAEVRVLYDMSAFVTSDNVNDLVESRLEDILSSRAVLPVQTTVKLPATGWLDADGADTDNPGGQKYIDRTVTGMTANTVPNVTIAPKSLAGAKACGLCNTCVSKEGKLRFYAAKAPTAELQVSVVMQLSGVSLKGEWTAVNVEDLVDWSKMPIATPDRAGAIKIGDNLDVKLDGTTSVNSPGVVKKVKAGTDAVNDMADGVLGS